MGFGTNDDSGMGLPPVMLGSDATRRLAVLRDEQNMADVFSECALAIEAMRLAQETLNLGAGASFETRNKVADVVGRAADHLENAIAAANGGAA